MSHQASDGLAISQRIILNSAVVMATCDSSSDVGVVLPKAMRSSMGQIFPGVLAVTSFANEISRRRPNLASLHSLGCRQYRPLRFALDPISHAQQPFAPE